MKPVVKTHFKLGVLTLVGLAAVAATALGLGVRSAHRETVAYHIYFDESVDGLAVGSIVRFRGVPVGAVSTIDIASDRRHVDVTTDLVTLDVKRLGFDEASTRDHLRAELDTQGITGVKYVDVDIVEPADYPPPALDFPTAENTIAVAPSVTKELTDMLRKLARNMPQMLANVRSVLAKVEGVVAQFQQEGVPARLGAALDEIKGAARDLRSVMAHVDRQNLPEKAAIAIDSVTGSLAKINSVVDDAGGDGGLLSSTQRAADSLGDLGHRAAQKTDDLDQTLRDLSEAAQAIRDLADSLERQPDMLLKGRTAERTR